MPDEQIYVIGHRPRDDVTLAELRTPELRVNRPINFYKIGIATDPEARLDTLQMGTPHELELVTTVSADDAKRVERTLHEINHGLTDRGEWFRLSHSMVASLTALDYINADNAAVVKQRWVRRDRPTSFYVMLHRVRSGELSPPEVFA